MELITITGSRGFIGTAVRKAIKYPYEEVDYLLGRDHKDLIGRNGILIYLSSWIDHSESMVDPAKYLQNNLTYLSMILTRNRFNSVIFPSSSMVYDKNGNLEPESVYGVTKLAGEKLIKIYCPTHWILRICNPYGPGDKRSVFAELARCKMTGDTFKIYKNKILRDYFPVSHIANVINRILDGDIPRGIYNVGSGESVETREYLCKFCEDHGIKYRFMESENGLIPGFKATENFIGCGQKEITEKEWEAYLK